LWHDSQSGHVVRVALVSNAESGSSDEQTLEEVKSILGELGEVSDVTPSSSETFDEETRRGTEGADLIVVAGGDGTLNFVINALGDRLGESMGTGNDFARALNVPLDPVEGARHLLDAGERSIDVGRATAEGVDRLFLNACIGGFPVDVDEAVDPGLKKKIGPVAFWIGGLKAFTDMTRATVTVNGEEITDCIAVGVGNGQTCGGGVRVWPQADPGDGLLDACAMPAPTNPAALKLAAKVKAGTHTDLPEVKTTRAPRITITSDPTIEFNLDGELVNLESPATFELVTGTQFRSH
jgi:YegS/Rv2252/BmrU family lipid kinase